jgi:hypothetical protein
VLWVLHVINELRKEAGRMAREPVVRIFADVAEPDDWNEIHYRLVAGALKRRAPDALVRFDGPRSPLADTGLSFRQTGGEASVSLGREEIHPDVIWQFQPISRVRDGLVTAAVQRLIDGSVLATALQEPAVSSELGLLADSGRRAVLAHSEALETAFPGVPRVNPPDAVRQAGHRPHNLAQAAQRGFDVPDDTLFTQDPMVAREWVAEQSARGRRVLWKTAVKAVYLRSDGKLRNLMPTEIPRAQQSGFPYEIVRWLPLIFETVAPGEEDLRVTALVDHGAFDGAVFAARITPRGGLGGGLDPRAGRCRWRRYQLPSDFSRKCVEYVRDDLHLFHAVLDFRLNPDGVVFLEAHGDGAWADTELNTGQRVGRAFAELLLAVARAHN